MLVENIEENETPRRSNYWDKTVVEGQKAVKLWILYQTGTGECIIYVLENNVRITWMSVL